MSFITPPIQPGGGGSIVLPPALRVPYVNAAGDALTSNTGFTFDEANSRVVAPSLRLTATTATLTSAGAMTLAPGGAFDLVGLNGTTGAAFQFAAGNGTTGAGGALSLFGGASTSGEAGRVNITGGSSTTGTQGGVTITGSASPNNLQGGGIDLIPGSSNAGDTGIVWVRIPFNSSGNGTFLVSGTFGFPQGLNITRNSSGTFTIGFFGASPIAQPSGVAVTAAGIHAALVSLGLIS